ncbi:NAD(P)/FAD-dependent oxidoreductase [Blastomonas fulva]|uniref:NAD(P)/FAD-dependent oxidoreductase n=1 Tax=Blastomonas fulva TaxID=1550728 RepID=UPI003F710EAA
MADVDVLIVGAGIVGLAVGRALASRGFSVAIAERHQSFGTEVSSRNSEVIHAGIYYRPGSLKARLCVQGREQMYAYCEGNGVAYRKCGKLIVAADHSEVERLKAIRANAAANGTTLSLLDSKDISLLEPDVETVGALFSPETGIVDSHGLMVQLLADFENSGGLLALASPVANVRSHGKDWLVRVPDGTISTRWLINCTGLSASRVALSVEGICPDSVPKTRFARGLYVRATPSLKPRHLIYPIPEPGGLGVHATIDLAGATRFGPDVDWIDTVDYSVDHSRIERFRGSIARYWPGVIDAELTPDYTGIRPKINALGEPDADFAILGPDSIGVANQIHLFGIESPGLTASLAIGTYVCDMVETTCK